MKCFYHEDRDAVSQCQVCGKGLCKECTIEAEGVCKDCRLKNEKEEFSDFALDTYGMLKDYKKEIISTLIKSAIFGVILVVLAVVFLHAGSGSDDFWLVPALFCTPFGFFTMTHIWGKDPYAMDKATLALIASDSANDTVSSLGCGYLIGKALTFSWKLIFSPIVAIPAVIYLFIKLAITNKRIKEVAGIYSDKMNDMEKKEEAAKQEAIEQVNQTYHQESTPSAEPAQTPAPAEPAPVAPVAEAPVAPAPAAPQPEVPEQPVAPTVEPVTPPVEPVATTEPTNPTNPENQA